MKLTTITGLALLVIGMAACNDKTKSPDTEKEPIAKAEPITELKIESLLRDSLALQPNLEVIVSYVEVPPNMALEKHYHPGEEFAYLIEGSGEFWLDGESIVITKPGEASKVPLKRMHSFKALDNGAKFIVFRIHEKGAPERIMANEAN
ncbi:Cupin domain-containing protein [Zhouia amylolytica]|uniref:Cupin domain-containing protein n=1 Tax=Zhouia amylolytica TaxID=376730 RepID=A0A1I6SA58_9FLAO|nr:cupin domain-containing protein [Zhouia amylolytica]MCQ0110946.1 cupin domain-containing protein [Zhouia amylolytica]SFS73826.1 Cupin domain-containing protein [Zhouia amylolytica]